MKVDIEYNTEKPIIEYPEYGRSIQEMLLYAKSIESRPHRQKTAEAIIGLMMQLVPPGGNRNMDDYRDKLWNHAFAIANYELDVTPPPGITIVREEERPKPEPIGYPASATRFRHYGNSIQALIKKAIEMPDGPKKEGFVEVIASYMKLAYKTWNKEHYVSDDIVKDDLVILSDGQLELHEGYESLDRLAAVPAGTTKTGASKTSATTATSKTTAGENATGAVEAEAISGSGRSKPQNEIVAMNRLLPPFATVIMLFAFFGVAAQPQQVRVGVYLMNLYDLNMDEHSFYADFYIWFKWKGKIDPTGIEFVNSIEKWSMAQAQSGDSSNMTLKDGTNYRIYRVEGRFFHSFSLNRFPLDKHALDIQIESPEHSADSLVYLPDTNAACIRNTLNLVGWQTKGCRLESATHDYKTDFGNPEENAQRYSNLTYSITLARPASYFILKMLLPLAIVMLVSFGALILHPSHIDTRSSLPIGGLLTAVFLQQSYSDALPDTGYMVLMDKIYLLSYFLISLVLLQVIRAGNDLMRAKPEHLVIRQERRLAKLYLFIFIAGVLILSVL